MTVPDLAADTARQYAGLQLGIIVVRATGSILGLIACGYESEAFVHHRIAVEAVLRGRQINDDRSGDVARKVLMRQPPRSVKSIAHHYGQKQEIEFLDHFAHADFTSLMPLVTGDSLEEKETEMRPRRGFVRPANQLYMASYNAMSAAMIVVEAFGVALVTPRWIDEQLLQYKENPLPDIL